MTQAFKIPKEGHPIIMKVKAYHKYIVLLFHFKNLEIKQLCL